MGLEKFPPQAVLEQLNAVQKFLRGRYPTGPNACVDDSSCKVRITSMRDGGPIIIFSFWALVFMICSFFQAYRWVRLQRAPVKPIIYREKTMFARDEDANNEQNSGASRQNDDIEGENVHVNVAGAIELQFTGYRTSIFGEISYTMVCFMSLQWIAVFVLILVDTYNACEVGGVDDLCFYGSNFIFGTYNLNGKVFFTVWWLTAFWFTTWIINKSQVHNWFRLPCELQQASVVHAWAKGEKEILSVNVCLLVQLLRHIKSVLMPPATQEHFATIAVESTNKGKRFFLYHGQRFLITGDRLCCAHLKVGDTFLEFHKGKQGLTMKEAENRLEHTGLNEIPFKGEPLLHIANDELFSLFHVYQLLMYMLMFWNSYLFVASLMVCIVLLSACITIYNRYCSQLVLEKITEYVTDAHVLRDGIWNVIDSRQLVPGDTLRVKSNWLLPCDLLILNGSCVCNESALTGESMPVQKYAAPNTATVYKSECQGARHTLYSGTTVLQAGTNVGDEVIAIVSVTGMATSKGKLLSCILFPEKMLFLYDEELSIVVILLLSYAIVCFAVAIYFQNRTGAQSFWVTKWIYCMAIFNQILSPLLAVALEVGHVRAVERLKICYMMFVPTQALNASVTAFKAIYSPQGHGILCLNPKRIAIAGKIRVFCFDKTGTLTKEGLDFIGVQSVVGEENHGLCFGHIKSLERGDVLDDLTLHGLATCHAVTRLGNQFVGNQVEVEMFTAVGWNLVETPNEPTLVHKHAGSKEFSIVKRNEFDHVRTTMSVIVRESQDQFHVYCKGSSEKIHALSSANTLPYNYMETARSHALEGCYVLGLSHRKLNPGISLEEVLALSREEVEDNLSFTAFILFRNELKADSQEAIKELKSGKVRPLMVTGDNAQCGYYIARQCGMVAPHVGVILGDTQQDGSVGWSLMSGQEESRVFSTDELFRDHTKGLEVGILELAVTGKAFTILCSTDNMEKLLFFTRIFARFTPADKVSVVDMHRTCGLIVGMCGDGGNDCGALKAAHAGIALSDAEASVVSPFTSRDKSVMSVVDLLREGRGALHTSFACYKFLIMYGLLFSILKLCCYWYGIIPCQLDFIFIDGVAVLSLGYAMTLSYPEAKLGKVRPTSSLLSPVNVGSIVGVWVTNMCFMIGSLTFMKNQPGYIKWPAKYSHGASWWTLGDNWESTVLFFTMYFQYITSAFIFSFGATFRKSVFFNWVLMVTYMGLLTFMSLLLLLPHNILTDWWHLATNQFNSMNPTSPVWISYQAHGGLPSPAMPFNFRFRLWWILIVNIAIVIAWQKVVVEGPIFTTLARIFPSARPKFHL